MKKNTQNKFAFTLIIIFTIIISVCGMFGITSCKSLHQTVEYANVLTHHTISHPHFLPPISTEGLKPYYDYSKGYGAREIHQLLRDSICQLLTEEDKIFCSDDTIEIDANDVVKFRKGIIIGYIDYKSFLLNRQTGKPLHGFYKINYDSVTYSIGYYNNGNRGLPSNIYNKIPRLTSDIFQNFHYRPVETYRNDTLVPSENTYWKGKYVLENVYALYAHNLIEQRLWTKKPITKYMRENFFYYYRGDSTWITKKRFYYNQLIRSGNNDDLRKFYSKYNEPPFPQFFAKEIKKSDLDDFISYAQSKDSIEVFEGDTLRFDDKNIIELNADDVMFERRIVKKRYKSLAAKFGSLYHNKYFEGYLLTKKDGKALHGLYNIHYPKRNISELCRYYDGRPFHPFGRINKSNLCTYIEDSFVIVSSNEKPRVFAVFLWDIGLYDDDPNVILGNRSHYGTYIKSIAYDITRHNSSVYVQTQLKKK